MQEICDQWQKDMREIRRERWLMIGCIITMAGFNFFVF